MIEPALRPHPILSLRPTQATVGFREVALKQQQWAQLHPHDAAQFLGRHMIPVVVGPGGHCWLIDHHHLALALHRAGARDVLVQPVAQLDHLGRGEFRAHMESRGWLHPYDGHGRRLDPRDLPRCVAALADDDYRSLAAATERRGGFAKSAIPYAEFLWADFFRRRIRRRALARFDRAVETALLLARSSAAQHLPGWCGDRT